MADQTTQQQPLDFSSVGGVPVPNQTGATQATAAAPARTTTPKPLDFSSIGGQRVQAPPTSATTTTQAQEQQPSGFASTVGSDLYNFGKGVVQLPGKAVAYAAAGQPRDNVDQQLADAQEAHKTAVYQQFRNDFHAGNYGKAFSGLVNLFDPHYDDPNDPVAQAMVSQWDSSAQAKNAMLDAAKQGDTLGVMQHAAGVLPVASQVDAAMSNYQKDPSRENLAHVVSSAIPAFVPALIKGTGYAADSLKGQLSPQSLDIAGQPVPVRAAVADPGLINKSLEGSASKAPLQKFDVTQTQPAARAAIAKVATEGVTQPSYEALRQADLNAAGKTVSAQQSLFPQDLAQAARNKTSIDGLWDKKVASAKGDFGQAYRDVKSELQRYYQKADQQGMSDGQGENAFSKAQRDQQAAFRSGNVDAEDAAIQKQKALFDKANGAGTFDVVKQLYSKLDAVDAINNKFTTRSVIKNTPSQFLNTLEPGQFDRGIIDGAALRTAVRELKADGTFAKAGVPDSQVLQLQRLGDLLERSKVQPNFKPAGWFGKIGGAVKTASGAPQALAYMMTHPAALNSAVSYLKGINPTAGVVPAAVGANTGKTFVYDPTKGEEQFQDILNPSSGNKGYQEIRDDKGNLTGITTSTLGGEPAAKEEL